MVLVMTNYPLCFSIEHLDPPVLARVPTAVFRDMQPKTVIVSTPNSEFNILFPDFHGFRHPDHRFEWTRSQFRQWQVTSTHINKGIVDKVPDSLLGTALFMTDGA